MEKNPEPVTLEQLARLVSEGFTRNEQRLNCLRNQRISNLSNNRHELVILLWTQIGWRIIFSVLIYPVVLVRTFALVEMCGGGCHAASLQFWSVVINSKMGFSPAPEWVDLL